MAIKAGSSKLVVLAEQTAFLLHQQQEMKAFYEKEYAEFSAVLHQKIQEAEKSGNKPELDDLLFIRNIIQEQAEHLAKEMEQDISFLKGQLDGITQVQELNDPEREKEFERMLLEDGHDLLPTPDFEREVLNEATSSKKSMSAMLNDFKNTLEEGGGTTLARLLEAMIDQQKEEGASAPTRGGSAAASADTKTVADRKPGTQEERAEYDMNDLGDEAPDLSKMVNDACCGKNDISAGDQCCSDEGVDIFSLLKQAADEHEGEQSCEGETMKDIKGCCLQEEQEKSEECTSSSCETKQKSSGCGCKTSCESSSGCKKSGGCKNKCECNSGCKADNGPTCQNQRSSCGCDCK